MVRENIRYGRKQVHAWILNNQVRDIEKASIITGKSKTDIISEALALWISMMHKEGVL
jgi:hypothetical protein